MQKLVNSGALFFGVALLLGGCSGLYAEDDAMEEQSSPLYDATTQNATAVLAMRAAYDRMVQEGNQYEFCGLTIRKTNGQYRASSPTTQWSWDTCSSGQVSLAAGERVAGYYHSHPEGIVPDFSSRDIAESERTGRMYYLVDFEGQAFRYDPATNTTIWLGHVYYQ